MFKALAPYPHKYLIEVRQTVLWFVGILGFLILLSGYFLVSSVFNEGSLALAATFSAVTFFFSFISYINISGSRDSYKDLAVAAYFDEPVPGKMYVGYGKILARNMRQLDEIARAREIKPFSDFGYADERALQTVVWYSPWEGTRTADLLLAFLATKEQEEILATDSVGDVKNALDWLRTRLDSAYSRGARFNLLLTTFYEDTGKERSVVREPRKGYF